MSQCEPVTIRHSDDTTALSMLTPNQTATKPPSPHLQHTQHQLCHKKTTTSPPTDTTLLASPHHRTVTAGNDTTMAFQTQHYNEASTIQVGGDSTLYMSKLSPNAVSNKPAAAAATAEPAQALIEAPSSMFVPGVHCTMTHIHVDVPVTNLSKRYATAWICVDSGIYLCVCMDKTDVDCIFNKRNHAIIFN